MRRRHGSRSRIWWALLLVLGVLVAPEPSRSGAGPPRALGSPEPPAVLAQQPLPVDDVQVFPETGQVVAGDFLHAWQAGGGVAILGLPLTGERVEIGEDGQPVLVQWFERARLERLPASDGQAPGAVQFGLLGRSALAGRTLEATETPAPGRLFPETGQAVTEPFLSFWERNGGLAVFGYPITGLVRETGSDGEERTVQYFERARFEDHGPAVAPRVRLGLLGREVLARPVALWWEAEEAVAHTFTTAFVYTGGLSQDQALYVASTDPAADGGRYRARYQVRVPRPDTYHFWGRLLQLDDASPLRWRIGEGGWQTVDQRTPPLGLMTLQSPHRYAWYSLGAVTLPTGWHPFQIEVATTGMAIAGLDAFVLTTDSGPPVRASAQPAQLPPPVVTLQAELGGPTTAWPRLHRGLAQGGEHPDPAYLTRVTDRLRPLSPSYIRLDHIFDYYDIVQQGSGRGQRYDFRRLDTALDAVLASGAQPFLSLGLTPKLLSPTGAENAPPANLAAWRDLVAATVRHINIERRLGVRYWEVWNEPNLTPFWAGGFAEYARLYEETAAAIIAVDPNARVGGPATSGHEYWVRALIDHVAATGARLDFISWHTYHVRPVMLANQVALIRRDLARYPRLRDAELMITEWSLHSDFGASAAFASDSHVVAAYAVAALHRLADAGLDQALFFEAVDGQPPPGQIAWGRWGVLTYDGRPKPVFHALLALNRLHEWRLPATSTDPRLGLLATRQGGRLALVAWHLALDGQAPQTVRLVLRTPPAGLTTLRRWTVDAEHSPLGGQLDEVESVAGTLVDGAWTATLTLAPNSVTLLTWEP